MPDTLEKWDGCKPEVIKYVIDLEVENQKLRAVAEAARVFIKSSGCNPKECGKCDPKYIGFCKWSGIGQALAELDKKEEQKNK